MSGTRPKVMQFTRGRPIGVAPTADIEDEFSDFWTECKEIGGVDVEDVAVELEEDVTLDDTETTQCKTPDEGEQEAEWLKQAGFSDLVSDLEKGAGLDRERFKRDLKSLTRPQREAVKKRVHKYNQTLRKRMKGIPDVREVFGMFRSDRDKESSGSQERITPKALLRMGRKKDRSQDCGSAMVGPFANRKISKRELDIALDDANAIEVVSIYNKMNPIKPKDDEDSFANSDTELDIGDSRFDPPSAIEQPTFTITDEVDPVSKHPVVCLNKTWLGTTTVGDLSCIDLDNMQPLAYIELTSVMDDLGLGLSATAHRRKVAHAKKLMEKDPKGMFGVPLELLVDRDSKIFQDSSIQVPVFFQQCVDHLRATSLHELGLLRVAGSVNRMRNLRGHITESLYAAAESVYNSGALATSPWQSVRGHDAAGLFKQFIRELPIPLLTLQYIDTFYRLGTVDHLESQLKALNLLVVLLPTVHRKVLKLMLEFLSDIIEHQDSNLMSLHNVTMIMAPNVFHILTKHRHRVTTRGSANHHHYYNNDDVFATCSIRVTQLLIHYHEIIWVVPASLIKQIRLCYEGDLTRKSVKESRSVAAKLFGRRKTESVSAVGSSSPSPSMASLDSTGCRKTTLGGPPSSHPQEVSDLLDGVIRIKAPSYDPVFSVAVQLSRSTTVAAVLRLFEDGRLPQVSDDLLECPEHLADAGSRRHSGVSEGAVCELYEVGGNIGERCLHPDTNMWGCYNENHKGGWEVRWKDKPPPTPPY